MWATGSAIAAANNVGLQVSSLPPGQFGIGVVAAAAGTRIPIQQGRLCLSGSIGRLDAPSEIFQVDPFGAAGIDVNLTALPIPSGPVTVTAGETWFFQAWHRDVVGGASTSNFTSGVEITFQ